MKDIETTQKAQVEEHKHSEGKQLLASGGTVVRLEKHQTLGVHGTERETQDNTKTGDVPARRKK